MDVHDYSGEAVLLERVATFDSARPHEARNEVCHLIMDTLAVDCRGDVYLCCAYPYYPFLRIGKYLELDADDLLMRRYTHATCASCAFPRRAVTDADRERLHAALTARIGAQEPAPPIEPPAPTWGSRVWTAAAALAGRQLR